MVVVVVYLPSPGPTIAVGPRGPRRGLLAALFDASAADTGIAEFDRRFRVTTPTPSVIRQVLGPHLIAEHLAGRAPTWSLANNELLTWLDGTIDNPAAVSHYVASALRIARLLGR